MLGTDTLEKFMVEELKIIQEVIKRIANNSFLIKGWAVTLVVGTLLLKADTGGYATILLAFIPLIVFWFLDAYYLRQERLYRKLYNWVRSNRMLNEDNLFDMNAYRFQDEVQSIIRTMFSITLGWFYGGTALLVISYWLCLRFSSIRACWYAWKSLFCISL